MEYWQSLFGVVLFGLHLDTLWWQGQREVQGQNCSSKKKCSLLENAMMVFILREPEFSFHCADTIWSLENSNGFVFTAAEDYHL